MDTVNDRIKKLRTIYLKEKLKTKLSQGDFGHKIGLTKSAVSCLESGRNNLTDQTAKLICQEFNVNEDWLKNGVGYPFIKIDKDKDIEEWVNKVMNGRPDNFQKRLLAVLTTLKEDEWKFLEQKARELLADENNKNSSNEIMPNLEESETYSKKAKMV